MEKTENDFLFDIFGLNPQISDYFLLAMLTRKIENGRRIWDFQTIYPNAEFLFIRQNDF